MSYLIFSSFDVGGLPFKMAKVLNKREIRTYYVSIQSAQHGHDSKEFHYGGIKEDWDLSADFKRMPFPAKVRKSLKKIQQDAAINSCLATGWKSYVLRQSGINYVYWSFGADLDQLYFSPLWESQYPFWKKVIRYCLFLMFHPKPVRFEARMSIARADSILLAPYQLAAYRKLRLRKELKFLPHLLDTKDFSILSREKDESGKTICEQVEAKRFLFSSARHVWCGSQSKLSDNKGNDIAIRSFSHYLQLSGDSSTKLILVEKGVDVDKSKALAKDLGTDHLVVWVNEMPREGLEIYYKGASVCFGQFGTPCLTYSSLEPLSFGTPCISYYEGEQTKSFGIPYYKEMPPVVDSKEPTEIGKYIWELLSEDKKLRELSYKSWLWTRTYCSEENFVECFIRLFDT